MVGLGNPGPTYAHTRHNVGFMAADVLAARAQARFSLPRGMRAEVAETRLSAGGFGAPGAGAQKVVLAKPLTFMNESGQAVRKLTDFFRIEPAQVIAIHDELDLEFGQLRLKVGGGDNGHNGLKSMRAHLGSGDFYRVRIGIGRPPGRQDAADYVLSPIPKKLDEELALSIGNAADAVEALMMQGLAAAQNHFNT